MNTFFFKDIYMYIYPLAILFFNIITFPFEIRAVVVFGLNELSGKTIDSQGSAVGAWNSSNAESLIRYTVNKGYNIIHGWELGKKFYAHI